MIFIRSTASEGGPGPSVTTLRAFTALALAAYPAGALVLLNGAGVGRFATYILGFGLITLALLAAAVVVGSRLQRITGEEASKLDEWELLMRHRAMDAAYKIVTAAMLIAIGYGAIATDKGWWLPTTYEQFNGLFWGFFLYVSLLPTTVLAWTIDADVLPAEGEA